MSHIKKLKMNIKHLPDLQAACERLGLEWVEGMTKFRYYAGRTGKCDHVIRIPGSEAYEIGVVSAKDGYDLATDFYQGGKGLTAAVGNNGERLKQEYSAQVHERSFRELGFRNTVRNYSEDGTLTVEAYR